MVDKNQRATAPRVPDEARAEMDETRMGTDAAMRQDTHSQPAHPDPETGEVPAGPGDAGLENRPEVNTGSPGTKQMSNRRLGIGIGIAALLVIFVFLFTTMV